MAQYIDKAAVVAEIDRLQETTMDENRNFLSSYHSGVFDALSMLENFLDTLEVKDPYEQYVQYDSIKAGIQDYAETYSFNIESLLFNQLTKEQQKLWREEIEQAVISGGEAGVELARDPRYKENFEVKKMDLEKEITQFLDTYFPDAGIGHKLSLRRTAKHFFELGLNSQTKDMKEALCTEYEKGRADAIAEIQKEQTKEYLEGVNRVQNYKELTKFEKGFDRIAETYAHRKNKDGYNKPWYTKERAAEMLYWAKEELGIFNEQ